MQKSDSKQKLQGRTAVVDTKFESLQWSLLDSVSHSSADRDRCIQKGIRCSMSRDIKREPMFKGGTVVTHKCIRTESSKTSTFVLQQTKFLESSSFSNRKHYYTTLTCENRGNREPNAIEMKQRDLAVSLETPDHNHCRTPSKFFECGGRIAVSKQQGPIRIETLPKRRGTLKVVLFASRKSHQLPQYFVENPTLSVRGQMPYDRFGEIISFMHFPHFTLFYKSWRKWVTTQQENVACRTNLAVSNLVTRSARYVYSSSTATSKEHKLNKHTKEVRPLIANRTLRLAVWTISGNYLRREFQQQPPNLLQVQDK